MKKGAGGASNGLLTDLVERWELQTDATASHNGNDGTATNVTWSSAAVFNGSNAYINFGDIDLATDGNYSINVWVKWSGTGTLIFLDKFTSGQPYPGVIRQNGSTRAYAAIYDGSTANSAIATVAYNNNVRHMLTLVRDDTGGTLKLYVDGSGTVYSTSDTLTANLNNTQNWIMGALATLGLYSASSQKYLGMWDKILSTTDIDNLYNSGTPLTYSELD